MAKRFTETEKWKDLWFKKLVPKYKLLWIYILDECNNAGLIELDLNIAGIFTGYRYSKLGVMETFGTRLFQITEDVWFIPKFIFFQYPKGLNNQDNVTQNVVNKLHKYSLIRPNGELNEVYCRPNLGIQVKEKEKEEVMVMEKVKEKEGGKQFKNIPPSIEAVLERCKEMNYPERETESEKFMDYYNSVGWIVGSTKKPMKDWSGALSNWFKNYKEYKNDKRNQEFKRKINYVQFNT